MRRALEQETAEILFDLHSRKLIRYDFVSSLVKC